MWTILWLFYIILSLSKMSKYLSKLIEVIATLVIIIVNTYLWKLINKRGYIVYLNIIQRVNACLTQMTFKLVTTIRIIEHFHDNNYY
jgi:hypothetical protein